LAANILIVEDENIVAMDIQHCLKNLGYAVPVIFDSGEEAILHLEKDRPDLVLMDIRLAGEMDGVEAAEVVRSQFHIPVVYLTAQVDHHTLERAKATGPFGYILKPFEERDLSTTIDMALSKHQMESRLRESEEHMRRIFENALDAVVTIDGEGRVTEWNPQAETTFGWRRDEILGRTVAETIIPQIFREDHAEGIRHFLATGAGPLLNRRLDEFTAIHRDGHEFPIELSISPVKYGDTYSFSAFVRDITERRQTHERLKKSEQKYRALVETTETGYVIIDGTGKVIDANAEYVRLTGHLTLQDILGRNVAEWTAEYHRKKSEEKIEECVKRGVLRGFEKHYVDKNSAITPVEINATVIETDEGPRILGLCRDITDRHEAEQRLKQSNTDLEEYDYAVSHELKDPLGTIMRHIQYLVRRYKDQLDESAHDHIAKTVQGAKYMERLINELIANAKIGRGSVEAVNCDIMLSVVLDSLQSNISDSGAVVTSEHLPTVNANSAEVAQVFQNLIGNAIKFRMDERPPRIHLGCQRDGNFWRFSVQDNGIGIAKNHQSRVFQIFEQIGEKDAEGTGIGLANCRKAVERRGGRIWVESDFGHGSTFFFTLPDSGSNE
jgi:PAS domain S-box-containing protein